MRPERGVSLDKKLAGNKPTVTTQQGRALQIDMRTAESMDKTLAAMNAPLSQAERLYFMTAFFEVARVEYCLWTGDYTPIASGGRHLSSKMCYTQIGRETAYFKDISAVTSARTYISDRRLDNNKEFVATNGWGASTRGGHSRARSYSIYVEHYNRMLNGKTRPEIEARYESYFRS